MSSKVRPFYFSETVKNFSVTKKWAKAIIIIIMDAIVTMETDGMMWRKMIIMEGR